MSLGRPYEATIRGGLRKPLALVGALLSSFGVFIFAAGEAWAQQVPPVVIDGSVAGPVNETPYAETPQPEAFPVDSTLPAIRHYLGSASGSVTASSGPLPQPEPVAAAPGRYDSGKPLYPGPNSRPAATTPELAQAGSDNTVRLSKLPRTSCKAIVLRVDKPNVSRLDRTCSLASTGSLPTFPEPTAVTQPLPLPKPDPIRSLGSPPAPGPVSFEENKPLSSRAEKTPVFEPGTQGSGVEGLPLLSSPGVPDSSVVELPQSTTVNALEFPADELLFRSAPKDEGPSGMELADLYSGGEAAFGTPVAERAEEGPEYSSTEAEGSSKSALRKSLSPFTPLEGSYFSGLDDESAPGSVVPLLFCVLVSGLILLRREDKLFRAFCEFPKPSSALLLPLERPG